MESENFVHQKFCLLNFFDQHIFSPLKKHLKMQIKPSKTICKNLNETDSADKSTEKFERYRKFCSPKILSTEFLSDNENQFWKYLLLLMNFEHFAYFIAHRVTSFFVALQQENSFEDRLHNLIISQLWQTRGLFGDLILFWCF